MRFKTIITLPAATTREKASRLADWIAQKVAGALPARVRYWTTMNALARATMDRRGDVMATPLDEILRGLDGGPSTKVSDGA